MESGKYFRNERWFSKCTPRFNMHNFFSGRGNRGISKSVLNFTPCLNDVFEPFCWQRTCIHIALKHKSALETNLGLMKNAVSYVRLIETSMCVQQTYVWF